MASPKCHHGGLRSPLSGKRLRHFGTLGEEKSSAASTPRWIRSSPKQMTVANKQPRTGARARAPVPRSEFVEVGDLSLPALELHRQGGRGVLTEHRRAF